MHKQFGTIVVIDIEATCWKKGAKPDDQEPEIIEIGICLLNVLSLEIAKPERILVKPQHSIVSPFCTQLTTLTQEQLDAEGISFAGACWLLKNVYKSHDYVWASMGEYESLLFAQQCTQGDVPNPFGPWHLNVRLLAGVGLGLLQLPGMQRALQLLNLSFEGHHHRAADDAYNTARLLALLLSRMRERFDTRNTSAKNP
jgi:inhibitor of KinA sporulation pathway (predicted exonuclease)